MKRFKLLSTVLLGLMILSFQLQALNLSHSESKETTSTNLETKSDYQLWQEDRLESLKQPNGWLSLVGLEWLHVGDNSIGSAADNDIQLSHGPEYLGILALARDKSMTFTPHRINKTSGNEIIDSEITANDAAITQTIPVYADSSEEETTVFNVDTFEFFVVERDKFAFRIKDSQAKTRIDFLGLEYFDEDSRLRIDAMFIPYEPAKIIPTVNVLGILTEAESPGRLEFAIDGEGYSLDALDSSDSYYMIFGDKTNGRSTYGPGRFVYTDGKVNEQGMVRIDFNKAYNPPCAFTPYSTCTLPPLQNRMKVMIEAGEKKYANNFY